MSKRQPTLPGGNRPGLKPCDCGDPKCDKMMKKSGSNRRPLSGMARVDPITNRPRFGSDIETQAKAHPGAVPVRFDDDGNIIGDYDPSFLKRVNKDIDKKTREGLYSLALGLPSRVRRYVKKIWKLQDKGNADWCKIADDMSPMAVKILDNRVEVVAYTGIVVSREGRFSDEKLVKISTAIAESDALLTLYAHFFLPGVSAHLAQQCSLLAQGGKRGYILGGVVDVVDYGRHDSIRRRARRVEAEKDMKTHGWEKPRRNK